MRGAKLAVMSDACALSRWDGESSEIVDENFEVGIKATSVNCGEVLGKQNIL